MRGEKGADHRVALCVGGGGDVGLLTQQEFVCLDCESTGLEPKEDRIIEIAVARFTMDSLLSEWETLVDPCQEIPLLSQGIHHITPDMVQGKPKIEEILPRVLQEVGDRIVVGHGVEFDIALIVAEAKRHHISHPLDKHPFIDTLRLARLYGESPSNSLQQLRQHFNIPAEGAHRAMNDVLVNIAIFKHLVQPYCSTEEVLKILEKPIRMKTMPLGKHKGRRFEEIPLEYLLWAERKEFDQDLLYSIRLELRNRKKGNGFGLASNPFSTLE